MKKILEYVKPYWGRISIGLVIKVIGTLMDLAIPYVLSYIVDHLLEKGDIQLIFLFGGIMIVFAIIGVTFNVIANRMASRVARDVTNHLRHDLFQKIESLSSAQVDEVTMPSLISRMSSDTYNIHQMVGMMQRLGVRAPILLIGGIIVTLTLDPILTLILLATLPFIVLVVYLVSKAGIPLFTKVQLAIDDMVRTIRENVSGIRVIKALSKAEYEKDRFEKVNKDVMKYELKSGYTMAKSSPLINVFLNIGLVGVIVLGAYRVNQGIIKVGVIISFTTYFTMILNAMLSITRIFVIYSRSSASAARIQYVFNLPKDLQKEEGHPIKQDEGYITFDHVTFSYNKKRNNLEDIHFSLEKGKSLGIIGATGSGKTTIVQLLMRFYDIDQGSIRIDGVDIRSFDIQELRKKFGVVFQNDTIFTDTIYENINFSRDLSLEDITNATEVAQAKEFISKEPEGIQTLLTPKGTNISGGQKQRLFIARALANHPDILILDDASSALDYKTDAKLRRDLKEHFSTTTQIIVAQRISSIMNCDAILVIDEGHMIGYGTHEELLKTVDVYQEIYRSQMGGTLS